MKSSDVSLVEHPVEVIFYAVFLRILIPVVVCKVCICTCTPLIQTHNLLLSIFTNFSTLLISHSVTKYWNGVHDNEYSNFHIIINTILAGGTQLILIML